MTEREAPAGTHIRELSSVPVRPVTLSDHRAPDVPGLRNVRTNWQLPWQSARAMLGRLSDDVLPPESGLAAVKFAGVSFSTRPARIARSMRKRPEPRANAFAGVISSSSNTCVVAVIISADLISAAVHDGRA